MLKYVSVGICAAALALMAVFIGAMLSDARRIALLESDMRDAQRAIGYLHKQNLDLKNELNARTVIHGVMQDMDAKEQRIK